MNETLSNVLRAFNPYPLLNENIPNTRDVT